MLNDHNIRGRIMAHQPTDDQRANLRSKAWFDNPANADMTALYIERTMNYGLTLEELQSGKPIIGIAQTGSDISPCNRHHIFLAERVKEGIREAGGICFELGPLQQRLYFGAAPGLFSAPPVQPPTPSVSRRERRGG